MKLLVTGGAGYIGSVVGAQLVAAGHEVVVLDNLLTSHEDGVPDGARFVRASIDDAAEVVDSSFDAVLHFAARSLVGQSVAEPELYWWNNLVGSLRLLDAMRAAGVRRLVFSSTAATYGQPAVSPITEDTPAVPINPYGQSKLAVDHALAGAARAYGLAAVSLRYFNVGGALGRHGERHDPETHLIPNVLMVPAGRRAAVDVFGTDYPTPDGTAIRDYLHVEDLGRAHLLALDWTGADDAAGQHRVYNLGSGTGYSVREVVEAVRRVTGHPVPTTDRERRAGDPPVLVASAERIAADLGWRPRHGLEQIVEDAWTFLQR
ncbi:UDP-glucose 4-epimerase GalE [Jiangella sp. DSM 45060]|uniref:UDP-glucose 4-epimerase GalE n=1 Tax=Jiangella sp. DSM 45060 TaxID=1798224 RepID=UPI00087D8B53|nr:UDP-glucose 4-epimerase GalE [Jiangella sp. DSM 45060]SDT59825.1 UDP-galactose 4-epimerase [Jiangella sp. DSM 45060]